jgi:outer membrane protein
MMSRQPQSGNHILFCFLFLALLTVFSLTSAAQTSDKPPLGISGGQALADNPLTLERAIELALRNDQQLQIAHLQVDVAGAQADQVRSYLLPQVSASLNKLWFKDPIALNIPLSSSGMVFEGPDELMTAQLQVAVPIYIGGTIPQYLAARHLYLSEEQVAERARQNVVFNVTKAYFAVLQTNRLLEVAKESVALVEAHRKQAQDFYEAQMVDKRDLLQAELRLAEVQQNLFAIEKANQLALSMFNKIIGCDIDAPTQVVDIMEPQTFDLPLDRCQTLSAEHRPELRQLQEQVAAARKAIQASKEALLPSVVGVASMTYTDSEFLARDKIYYAGLNISFDAFTGGRKWAQISEASTRHLQACQALDDVTEMLKIQVKDAWLSVIEAQKKLSVAEAAVEQAVENMRIVENQYTEQMVSSTDVLDAQTALTNARANHANALYLQYTALAQLEWALGTAISSSSKGTIGEASEPTAAR